MLGLAPGLARAEALRQIAPPPSGKQDPALGALIDRMRLFIKERDHRALTALMGPAFRVEFDVGKGPLAFTRHWQPASTGSRVWDVLGQILSLDGYYYSETLCVVPHIVARYPIDLDPLNHVVAVREGVTLHSLPAKDSPVSARLDHAIIALAKPMEPPVVIPPGKFLEVVHPEAGNCHVSSADVYHPAAHRAFFEKRAGRWRWISLAAATLADPPELMHSRKRT
jgi:hypothetical protein